MFRQLSFQEIARLTICLLPLCLFFPHAHAQSPTDLDRLIFEPALLNRETGEEISRYTYPVQFLSMNLTPIDNNIQVENPLSILEIRSNINEYLEDVADLETSDGPYTGDLFQTLMNLGIQYQMLGDHEQAIETFQRAEHISRINSGLYHPDQYASTEKMIQSYLAMGDIRNANLKQRYMLYINQQHFGITTPETLPTLVNLAQSNMENFQHIAEKC